MIKNITKKVLFFDPKRQYQNIKREIDDAISRVLSSGNFILGAEVESLEKNFAKYCDCAYGIGTASGTEALYISLLACGIKPGDEIITVANAGVPTVCAITMTGAIPVFVDINAKSYNMDVSRIEEKITRRTKAMLPVHLYGQCSDMDPILKIAKRNKIKIIEDACQAHGARYKGKKAGSIGDIGCFSFYPTKNLGGYGDGGMIVTNNKILASMAKLIRDYGQSERYNHTVKGINSRLDEIQAAVINVKLKRLDNWNKRRCKIADLYGQNIKNDIVIKPKKMDYGTHIYHLYVIRCKSRDKLKAHLDRNGIRSLIHYPKPVYLQKAYSEFSVGNDCPVTEECSKSVLSIPLYPEISDKELDRVCDSINSFKIYK